MYRDSIQDNRNPLRTDPKKEEEEEQLQLQEEVEKRFQELQKTGEEQNLLRVVAVAVTLKTLTKIIVKTKLV
jgi:hypothetical protein